MASSGTHAVHGFRFLDSHAHIDRLIRQEKILPQRDEAVRGRRSLSVASVFRVIIVALPWPKYVPLTHAMGTHFLPIYFCRTT